MARHPPPEPAVTLRPLALGYLRLHAGDPPEVAIALTADLQAHADAEHLTLAAVYTDLLDPPADRPDRAGFCALMDTLRRHPTHAVIIPAPEHLSRRPSGYLARRTIIETEGGARLLVIYLDTTGRTTDPLPRGSVRATGGFEAPT